MAHLGRTNPLAYALYMNAKAVSDAYGRMPSEPDRFAIMACPLWDLPEKKVAQALADMVSCKVIEVYEDGGDRFLQICNYHEIEETNWQTVGRPEYPHPSGWVAPEELCDYIIKALQKAVATGKQSKTTPERYKLNQGMFGAREQLMISTCCAYDEHVLSTCSAGVDLLQSRRGAHPSVSFSPSLKDVKDVSEGENPFEAPLPGPQRLIPKPLPPVADTDPADFEHVDSCQSEFTQAFVRYFNGSKAPEVAQGYAQLCRQQLRVPNAGLTEDGVMVALREGNGPQGKEWSDNFGPETYLARLLREKREEKSAEEEYNERAKPTTPEQAAHMASLRHLIPPQPRFLKQKTP